MAYDPSTNDDSLHDDVFHGDDTMQGRYATAAGARDDAM